MNNDYKISVIIPVYGVEKYIQRCLISCFSNTIARNCEFIIVNDCTKDDSMHIAEKIILDYPFLSITIINHEINKGLAAARLTGVENANGEYVLFVDSDDWIESNMIEMLYENTKKEDSDIAVCDYVKNFKSKSKTVRFKLPTEKRLIPYAFIKKPGYMNFFCTKLIKKNLFLDYKIEFPIGISLCEDLFVVFKLCFFARKITRVKKALYHYNQANPGAITKNYTKNSFYERLFVTENIVKFLNENTQGEYEKVINFYKLYTKLMLILFPNLRDEKLYKNTFQEADKYVWKVPLRFDHKVLVWLCNKGHFSIAYFLQDLKKR